MVCLRCFFSGRLLSCFALAVAVAGASRDSPHWAVWLGRVWRFQSVVTGEDLVGVLLAAECQLHCL